MLSLIPEDNSYEDLAEQTREQFLAALRHHFQGWLDKANTDFSQAGYDAEIANLEGDEVYTSFGFAIPEYVLVRLMGRMSISIGRRIGQIYDDLPRYVAQGRFGLTRSDVVAKYGTSNLELDVRIPYGQLSDADREHAQQVVAQHLPGCTGDAGIGIEIRYNFNPNDSARLRKDAQLASLLRDASLIPVYLIFSGISPRDEAIARLQRAGWTFLIGANASQFMIDLTTMDLASILDEEEIREEVHREVGRIMDAMFNSPTYRQVTQHREQNATSTGDVDN